MLGLDMEPPSPPAAAKAVIFFSTFTLPIGPSLPEITLSRLKEKVIRIQG